MKIKTVKQQDLPPDEPENFALNQRDALPEEFNSEITAARRWRMADVQRWDTTLEFLKGYQSDYRSRYVDGMRARLGDQSFRQVVNRLIPLYKSFVAALETQLPKLHVASRSPSYDDELKQMSVELVVNYWWKANKISDLLYEGTTWLSPCGNAALHTYVCEDKSIKTDVVSAYDLLFEAEAIRPEEAEWCAVRRGFTRSQAAEIWPDYADKIQQDAASIRSNGSDILETSRDGSRIEAWYVYFCDGRCGTWMEGVGWLEQGRMPDCAKPVALFRTTVFPGRILGESQLWPVLYQQVEYNLYRRILLDGAQMMSNPLWLVPEQANVNRADLSNRAGAVVNYNALGGKPERAGAPPMPPHLFDIKASLMGEMEDIAGIHSMTMGKRAPGISAAVSMQTLISQDVQQLSMTRKEIERAVVQSAQTAVALWREFAPNKVKVSYFDPTFGMDVIRTVERTNLLEEPQVFIEAGQLFVADQQERDQMLLQLAQLGVLDPKILLDNLSMTVDRKGKLEKLKSIANAKRCLAQVLAGFNVEWVEDPATIEGIVVVFREYITSPLYDKGVEELLNADPNDVDKMDARQIRDNVYAVYVTAQQQLAMLSGMGAPQQPQGPQGSQPKPEPEPKPQRGGGVEGVPMVQDQRRQTGPSAAKPVQGDKGNLSAQDRSGSMQTRGVRGAP